MDGGKETALLTVTQYAINEKLKLSISGRIYDNHFTLPKDWNLFTEYLDKYIDYHTKPQPKEGEHWKEKGTGAIVKLIYAHVTGFDASNPSWTGEFVDGRWGNCINESNLERPATPEEIAEFKKQEKETALIKEAKERYPKGTKVKWFIQVFEVKDNYRFDIKENDLIVDTYCNDYVVLLNEKGEWVEKVEIEEEEPKEQKELADNKKLKRRLIAKSQRINELEEMVRLLVKRIEDNEDYDRTNTILNEAAVNAAEELLNNKPKP